MSAVRSFGPVRVVDLVHPAGVPAEVLVRDWLAGELGVEAATLAFDRGPHGRPLLQRAGVDCNWSHSGTRLAIALGDGVRVGIDIESPKPRPRALELARRYFHADEADALERLPAELREAAFLRLWCAKEAVLKAQGRGLAFGLDRLHFDRLDGVPRLVTTDAELGAVATWRVEPLAIDGLVGSVAWRPSTAGDTTA
ncbi:4-phosphopantetheinyl transferase [Lysobacter sp. TY2-98]|uniref:4'-phosphopantetheinyl transferase family protein n=1 Tax=Lysobacter sp. TY2-98 TaxID=2290922 RepID=UPI000E200CA3|nr:4'-phosphopantetheinyl transferase superfamily protein [Lysobacter sp. TY2-98]AXK73089.1 4-phosphopantetheinyl transferase [Lysobacter sp. TY2-98]